MKRRAYNTDLSDAEWRLVEVFIPPAKRGGRPARHERRELANGMLYVLRTGCAWRHLPHDLPPWQTVYCYFAGWEHNGTSQRLHDGLRDITRYQNGRSIDPSAAIIDSQSVKSSAKGGTGGALASMPLSDAAKQVKGRKRHLVVDSNGWLLHAQVHDENVQDRVGARSLLQEALQRYPKLWVI